MSDAHSEWSASGFEQVMLCPGSRVLQKGLPDRSSIYAAEGTAAHQLLEWTLTGDTPAAGYVGRIIEVVEEDATYQIEVTDEMADYVQQSAGQVLEYRGDDGVMLVEQRVHYGASIGLPDDIAWGTADVIILRGDEIIVIDLKYGRGVEVDVETSPQPRLYALGALQEHDGLAGDFERVRMVILQPRVKSAPSEFDITAEELRKWGKSTARSAVFTAMNADGVRTRDDGMDPPWESVFLRPGEKQCKFCRAKAICPKLRDEVASTVHFAAPAGPEEFADLDPEVPSAATPDDVLSVAMGKLDLIEDWVKAVRAEVERRLLAGAPVTGFKLVQGKQGNRAWKDKTEAEEMLKSFRLKQEEMYDMSLISPTTAEKLLAKESPRRWTKLQDLIVRAEGKPSVAPITDKRPALEIKPAADDFAVVEPLDDLA